MALKYSLRFKPILASSYDNHSRFICEDAIIDLPYTNEEGFINALNECIHNQNIKFIIPTHDSTVVTLTQNRDSIDAVVVASEYNTALICRYKSKTYEALCGFGFIPYVYSTAPTTDNEYPLFAKDDVGQGGRNCFVVKNSAEMKRLQNQYSQYLFCEFLPGDEITVDCFTDRPR